MSRRAQHSSPDALEWARQVGDAAGRLVSVIDGNLRIPTYVRRTAVVTIRVVVKQLLGAALEIEGGQPRTH